MEFKGTKGKWRVVENDTGNYTMVINTDGTNKLAVARNYSLEVNNANLLLISKAPEMLEALSRLLELTKEMEKRIIDIEKLSYADPKFLAEIQQLIKEATKL